MRTARSPLAAVYPEWRERAAAVALYERLRGAGAEAGWSAAGFCGIPSRVRQLSLLG